MNRRQLEIVNLLALVLAGVMFVFYFGVDFVRWLTWRPGHDFFSQLTGVRPPFPRELKHLLLGWVVPLVLVGYALVQRSGDREDD